MVNIIFINYEYIFIVSGFVEKERYYRIPFKCSSNRMYTWKLFKL